MQARGILGFVSFSWGPATKRAVAESATAAAVAIFVPTSTLLACSSLIR